MVYIIDTHALVWFLTDHPNLGKGAKKLLGDRSNSFILPAIVAAEVLFIIMKRRASLNFDELWQHIDDLENL